jgi:glycosyltransferase involved in cell wall biosynthesis
MGAGKAVIATGTDRTKELISHPAAFTAIKDPVALAEKICFYLHDDAARIELGAALRSMAGDKFGLKEMVDATEEVYREALGTGHVSDHGALP